MNSFNHQEGINQKSEWLNVVVNLKKNHQSWGFNFSHRNVLLGVKANPQQYKLLNLMIFKNSLLCSIFLILVYAFLVIKGVREKYFTLILCGCIFNKS